MQARGCGQHGEGITNLSKHVGALLVLYLGIMWMALFVLVLVGACACAIYRSMSELSWL